MSRPDTAPATAADLARQVDAAVAELDHNLRRLRLSPRDRRAVLAEIRTDLDAAAAAGVPPSALIGPDPGAFAREAAAAGGHTPRPRYFGRILAGGLLGAAAALVGGYLLVFDALFPYFTSRFDLPGHHPTLGFVVVLTGLTTAGLLGVFAALAAVMHRRPAGRATLSQAAWLLPIAGVISVLVLSAAIVPETSSDNDAITAAVVTALVITAALITARVRALRAAEDAPTREDTTTQAA